MESSATHTQGAENTSPEAANNQPSGKNGKNGETYKRICKLGKGAYGTAYLVECQSNG